MTEDGKPHFLKRLSTQVQSGEFPYEDKPAEPID